MVQNTNLFVLKRILLHFKIFTFCTFVQVQCAYNSLGPVCCMLVYSIARTLKCYIPLPPHCPQETCLYSWIVSCLLDNETPSSLRLLFLSLDLHKKDEVLKAPTVWWLTEWLLNDCWLTADWLLEVHMKLAWRSELERWRLRALDKLAPDGRTNFHFHW